MQFGLRSMLSVVTVFCIMLGGGTAARYRHARAIGRIKSLGGAYEEFGEVSGRYSSWIPDFCKATRGRKVAVLFLGKKLVDSELRCLVGLCRVDSLGLHKTSVTDNSIATVMHLPHLEALSIVDAPITDQAVMSLAGLERLRSLRLAGTAISDLSVNAITGMVSLKALDVMDTKISAEGIRRLRRKRPELDLRCDEWRLYIPTEGSGSVRGS